MAAQSQQIDYTINNPDSFTKYKTAGQISEKVLAEVSKLCVAGSKVPGEPVKIQLGAQIDGLGTIVCDTVLARKPDEEEAVIEGRMADLLLATYYANEVLLRLMIPPGLLAQGSDEEKAKAAAAKPPSQAKITSLLEKVTQAYDCHLVESTTSWLFERNEIESSKKIVLAPGENTKGEGVPAVGEVWGVETGVSLGSGKVKQFEQRATLHRRTNNTYSLKRPTSRKILYEVQKKFGTFPFSLRQLDDERDAKSGVIECVRGNVFRQYEVTGDKDNAPVARLLTTIAITKNGITRLGGPPPLDLSKVNRYPGTRARTRRRRRSRPRRRPRRERASKKRAAMRSKDCQGGGSGWSGASRVVSGHPSQGLPPLRFSPSTPSVVKLRGGITGFRPNLFMAGRDKRGMKVFIAVRPSLLLAP
ncbi:hypothetical protein VTH06DRAFT_3364 [Thermothelomyces fergusii]